MSTAILPRSAWTDTKPGFSRALVASQVDGAACHYPGDGNVTRAGYSRSKNEALLRAYRRWHLTGRGWPDIGYCYGVSQAGDVWVCAGDKIAAHSASPANPTANHHIVGILLIIGNNEAPTPAMIAAVNGLLATLKGKFPKLIRVMGHRQVPGASTSCPGDATIKLINAGTIGLGKTAPTTPPRPTKPAPPPARDPHTAGPHEWPAHELRDDGDFGPITRRAYQRMLSWDAAGGYTGLIDADLGSMSVKAEQRWLKRLGYYTGLIDGDRGSMTIKALQRFLRNKGHYRGLIDGNAGTMTVRALQRYLNVQRQYA